MEYIRLFDNETQGTGTSTSEAFTVNYDSTLKGGLRLAGTLDGGSIVIQTLDPSTSVQNASDSDWVSVQNTVMIPSYYEVSFTKANLRLKATNLGASANFTVDFFPNKR